MQKISPVLLLCLLLTAALYLEAFILNQAFYIPAHGGTWAQAREYCQKHHVDLVAVDAHESRSFYVEWMKSVGVRQVWIGLLRDPTDDSVWRWIDLRTGEGISGDNVSEISSWAEQEQSSHCAFVKDNKWYSRKCSNVEAVYCSEYDNIKRHSEKQNWYKASQFCKDRSHVLATINQQNKDLDKSGWIGLYRKGGDTWRWISGLTSAYRNWAEEEPLTLDCAALDADTEKFHSVQCSSEIRFLCYDDNLVLVKENKTWEEARNHCNSLYTPCESSCIYKHSLLSLNNVTRDEYVYIRDRIYKATSNEVWTGLRFLGDTWWWMNGNIVESNGKLPDCPSQWKHCGTLSKSDTRRFITRDCTERKNFICFREEIKVNQSDTAQTSQN